jgi:hypothetical protein
LWWRSRACAPLPAAQRPHLVEALTGFAGATRQYVVVSTVFGLIVALVDVAALYWLDVPLPWLWGLLAFITNYIPNIGFVLGLIPPALLAMLQGGVRQAVLVIVAYSVINVVIQSLIQPKFVGDAVGLSVTLTFLSLVFWTFVIGPLGALLAVPLSLFVKALLVDADPDSRWLDPLIAPGRQVVQPMRLAPVGRPAARYPALCWGCCCSRPSCSPPSALSPERRARDCPRSGSTSGSSARSMRRSSQAVRPCSSSSAAAPIQSGRSRRSSRSPPGCFAPPWTPAPSNVSSPPSPNPLLSRARRRGLQQLRSDRPRIQQPHWTVSVAACGVLSAELPT